MKAKPSSPAARHIPRRTCVACRKIDAKRGLVRIVSSPDGKVQVDLTGKKSGRGAYLCQSSNCWQSALRGGRLEQALRTVIKPEDKIVLENYALGIDNSCNQREGVV